MFWNREEKAKKQLQEDIQNGVQKKLLEFSDEIVQLKRDMRDIRDGLEKLEIKALESRKIYGKKLKQMFGDEEKQEDDETKSINNPVILPYNGSFK